MLIHMDVLLTLSNHNLDAHQMVILEMMTLEVELWLVNRN